MARWRRGSTSWRAPSGAFTCGCARTPSPSPSSVAARARAVPSPPPSTSCRWGSPRPHLYQHHCSYLLRPRTTALVGSTTMHRRTSGRCPCIAGPPVTGAWPSMHTAGPSGAGVAGAVAAHAGGRLLHQAAPQQCNVAPHPHVQPQPDRCGTQRPPPNPIFHLSMFGHGRGAERTKGRGGAAKRGLMV